MVYKNIYPSIFHKFDGGYCVEFPDFADCKLQGKNLEDAVSLAEEALALYIISMLDLKLPIPSPTDPSNIELKEGEFVNLITVDVNKYQVQKKSIKKTLTIPEWLNDIATKKGINFSKTLQSALINQIKLGESE